MKQKKVKIIGLSINKDFGGLKATELEFDTKNRLTIIKGEVGSGKTLLNKAMRLTTQGSGVLEDKLLYGDVDVVTQLSDGDQNIFVGCRSDKTGALNYFLYTIKDGKKVKDVVVDGEKLTPAGYLKSLQTALTWRLDELTSENATTQRNILLELYREELEKQGVIFDKTNPDYVGGIIDKIEKAKAQRSLMDMKRKEVGGIADDLSTKGVDYSKARKLKTHKEETESINRLTAKITITEENVEQTKENELNKLKAKGSAIAGKLMAQNTVIIEDNKIWNKRNLNIQEIDDCLILLGLDENQKKLVLDTIKRNLKNITTLQKELKFDEEGKCLSKSKKFKDNELIYNLLKKYSKIGKKYLTTQEDDFKPNTERLKEDLDYWSKRLIKIEEYNKEAEAVNAFWDWKNAEETVKDIKKDYYLKLTEINTGVKGLHICPEFTIDENGDKIAKDNNIYLMYNGQYDTKYFNNKNKELRKLSSYSGTQKPMICLLIQNYLLQRKNKVLPYLWIDNIPIDNKTKTLLEKMAHELDLWLFVNWTGDFKAGKLKDGEMLLENGKILVR